LRATARQMAEAYAIGDAATFASLRSVRIEVEQAARIHCHELKGITIDSVTMTDDATANVRATVERTDWTKHLLLTLHRDGDRWRLTNLTTAERAMAAQLIADPTRLDALVRDEPELLTRDLANALADRVTVGAVIARPVPASAATAVLENLAALLGDPATRALAATAEATVADAQGDTPHAKAHIAEALALARESKDPEVLVRAMVIQARSLERGANGLAPALAAIKEALPLIDRLDNRLLATYIVGDYGNLQMRLGNTAEALTWFQRAAAMSQEIDDFAGMNQVESAEGLMLQNQGNDELAIAHLLRANEILGNDPSRDVLRGENFIFLAISYAALGRKKETMDALHNAGEIGRRSRAPIIIGETHRLLGTEYRRDHDYVNATREIEEALTVFENSKRVHFIPGAMADLALTRLEAGDARDTVARADRCADTSRGMEEPLIFIECRTLSGEAHRILGENDAALASFRDAIAASEEHRRSLVGDARQRTRFLARVISPYTGAADILAERGDAAAALEMTEQAKARTLLEILGGDTHKQNVLTPAEQQHDAELTAKIAALNRKHADTKELDAARADYESYQVMLDAAHPRRQALQGAVPIAKPSDVAALLGATTAIVEYVVASDHTRAFVITDRGVTLVPIKAGSSTLDPIVARFTEALAHDDLAYRKDAQALYAMLMQPLASALRGRKAICIVPDGSLWRLPFEALIDRNGKFVIESRTCFYAPSMSVLANVTREGARPKEPATLLAVANPIVRGAEAEVRALRSLYGDAHSRVYVGKEATEAHVTNEMQNARVLHFATHAIFDEANPMYSEVELAPSREGSDDGMLAAWEIMRLNLRADIAVLSACDTARGRLTPGEGVIGFTWALFVAGCPSSVVSAWKVDSASTKQLMVAFHRALLASHETKLAKAEALRKAKLALLRDPATRHPFYWSAFVLVGSPSARW